MKNRKTSLMLWLGSGFVAILTAGAVTVLAGWDTPCWISDRVGYLSRSCAREQLEGSLRSKNLEVIDIRKIRVSGKDGRKVEFRSRLRKPPDDDSANIVFGDSVTFRRVDHKWRLDSSS